MYPFDEKIFSCQTALPEIGKEGQIRLNQSSLLVVGLGGLGCAALPYLAASGIARIGLLDFDKVEPSNLPRQTLYGEADIGHWKAEAAVKRLRNQYPKIQFEHRIQKVQQTNLSSYDLILDATDNAAARYAINDACRIFKKPWIYGSIQEWKGQVAFFHPPDPDYRILFPDARRASLPTCSLGGLLGPMAGCIGAIQALEAIRFLATGQSTLKNKLLLFDAQTWRTQLLHFSKEENRELALEDLKELLQKELLFLIDASRPFPSGLSKDRILVFHCPSGVRSAAAAQRFRLEGYKTYYVRTQ